MADTVIIVTGAGPLSPLALRALPRDAPVVAADGGLDRALAAGMSPSIVVGDLDSITDAGRQWATAHASVIEHPTDKPATDTELAVDVALEQQPRRLVLAGNDDGTRVDHVITAIGVLGQSRLAGLQLEGWWGTAHYVVVHPGHPVTLDADPGAVFSVLALHGAAHGVSVAGAKWELERATLPAVSGLGVSNEVSAPPLTVSVDAGVLTVVVPHTVPPLPRNAEAPAHTAHGSGGEP